MHVGLELITGCRFNASRALGLLVLVALAAACGAEGAQDSQRTQDVPGASWQTLPPAQTPPAQGPIAGAGAPVEQATAGEAVGVHSQPDQQTSVPGDIPVGESDSWCAALAVMRTQCQSCHGEELAGGAPFPLVTYEDTQAAGVSDPAMSRQQLIDLRIHDPARPMPPLSQPRLSPDELAAFERWIAAGMPNASAGCSDLPEVPAATEDREPEWPADCEERYEIRAHNNGGVYTVPADTEQTVDISIPVPWAGSAGEVQALAIRPLTNNKRVVHHWILYAGVGEFITSWSPGKPMEVFPEGVGVHMPTSGTFRLNMHYYNIGNPQPEPDQSGLEVCITRNPRPYTATTHMFSGSASVPAGARVDNVSTCNVVATEPVHLITSSPHMHQYGRASKLEIIRAGGAVEVLEDAPFNWEDQHVTPVDAVLNTGDKVRMTCSYENTSDHAVRFGSSSEDEMCLNFARYYPMGAFSCTGGSFF